MLRHRGCLAVEDGTVFRGELFGDPKKTFGELIFNTSMSGYQEIVYDPSYRGQIVVMTFPLIGNYGTNREDEESSRPHTEGFVVHELSAVASNFRSTLPLDELFVKQKLTGIHRVDTRRITLMLREKGALRSGIFPGEPDLKTMVAEVRGSPALAGKDLVKRVSRRQPFWWSTEGARTVAVIDCGVKHNILRLLAAQGFKVVVVPAAYPAEEIVKLGPSGILLSNGPGDPEPLDYVVATVANLVERFPVFGICLGQQILGMVFGGKTYKLKFGHHGANHPVRDLGTGKIFITVQNHGFCVDVASLKDPEIEITHVNLNDGTLEGFRHKKLPVFSVQFHPEAAPGPHDAARLFARFAELVNASKN